MKWLARIGIAVLIAGGVAYVFRNELLLELGLALGLARQAEADEAVP